MVRNNNSCLEKYSMEIENMCIVGFVTFLSLVCTGMRRRRRRRRRRILVESRIEEDVFRPLCLDFRFWGETMFRWSKTANSIFHVMGGTTRCHSVFDVSRGCISLSSSVEEVVLEVVYIPLWLAFFYGEVDLYRVDVVSQHFLF